MDKLKRTEQGPLRVIEVGSWLAAPGATALLADMGAEVIKVEPPSGDPGRQFISAMGGEATTTPSFSLLNRGKKSVVIDFSDEIGRHQLQQLITGADVFVTNLRPSSLSKLGLSLDALVNRHPKLICASLSGLGMRGPECDEPTYDVGGFWARSGLMYQLTSIDSAPITPTGGFGDIAASLALYAAIVTALLQREKTGKGGLVETSLLQTGAFIASGDLAFHAVHDRLAPPKNRTESATPLVNCYQSKDKRWFYLTSVEAERHIPKICGAIGNPELAKDERFASASAIRKNSAALISILDDAFSQRTLSEWAQIFIREDVWWQPLTCPDDTLKDPQLEANNMLQMVCVGDNYYPMVTTPFNISGQAKQPTRSPDIGEHTDSILSNVKAVSDDI